MSSIRVGSKLVDSVRLGSNMLRSVFLGSKLLWTANRPPQMSATIPGIAVVVGQTRTVSLSSFFSDPDLDDTLSYQATASSSGGQAVHVMTSTQQDVLSLTGLSTREGGQYGTTTIAVTARDPDDESASQQFSCFTVASPLPKVTGLTIGGSISSDNDGGLTISGSGNIWDDIPPTGFVDYRVQISTRSDFGGQDQTNFVQFVKRFRGMGSRGFSNPTNVRPGDTIYIRVRVEVGSEVGPWSDTVSHILPS